jgi:enamine deaminase RidA (YjgF/YER057c/UK114 family)
VVQRQYIEEPAGVAVAPEPYAHAVRCGDTIYIAGQVAFDEDNRVVGAGDPAMQAERVWHNLRLVVESAGGRVQDIVKITVFLKDIRDAPAEIAARERHFEAGWFPICTMIQAASLGLSDLLMEIDAIAVVPSDERGT